MHFTSVELNQILNQYICHHLKGTELALITRFFLNLSCRGRQGHDLDDPYCQPLSYTARTTGKSKETIRRSMEHLHALGLITVDGRDWEQCQNKKSRRRNTGMLQEIRLSSKLKDLMDFFKKGIKKPQWPFGLHEKFQKKVEEFKDKARKAKERFMQTLTVQPEKPAKKEISEDKKRQIVSFIGYAENPEEYRKLIDESARHLLKHRFVESLPEAIRKISVWMIDPKMVLAKDGLNDST